MVRSLGIVGFLTAIVGMECAAVWFLLTRAESTAAGGAETPAAGLNESGESSRPTVPPASTPDQIPQKEGVEVDLGEYTITCVRLSTNTTLRADFHLFGLIANEEVDDFNKLWPNAVNRFREIVITTVRAAQPADLADPSLALIKRQILEKSNRLFGKPLIQALIVSNFSLVEQ
ncbi:MAG: hypothetical protein NZ899_09610 [Thermoguttaceae bacterium]|nr:hypothetical protein [Thermoguttaceae bacterium]